MHVAGMEGLLNTDCGVDRGDAASAMGAAWAVRSLCLSPMRIPPSQNVEASRFWTGKKRHHTTRGRAPTVQDRGIVNKGVFVTHPRTGGALDYWRVPHVSV